MLCVWFSQRKENVILINNLASQTQLASVGFVNRALKQTVIKQFRWLQQITFRPGNTLFICLSSLPSIYTVIWDTNVQTRFQSCTKLQYKQAHPQNNMTSPENTVLHTCTVEKSSDFISFITDVLPFTHQAQTHSLHTRQAQAPWVWRSCRDPLRKSEVVACVANVIESRERHAGWVRGAWHHLIWGQ